MDGWINETKRAYYFKYFEYKITKISQHININ